MKMKLGGISQPVVAMWVQNKTGVEGSPPTPVFHSVKPSATVAEPIVSEVLGNLNLKLFGCGHGGEAGDSLPFLVNDELGEVPLDFSGFFFARLFIFEPLVKVAGIVAVDFDFGEHREGHVVLRFGEFGDLCIGAGLLGAELVTRKSEDGYAFGCFMKRTQTCVLRREASSGSDVDDQANLTGIRRKCHCFARYGRHGEVGESSHKTLDGSWFRKAMSHIEAYAAFRTTMYTLTTLTLDGQPTRRAPS